MTDELPSWQLKIARAEKHLGELQDVVQAYLDGHYYGPRLIPPILTENPTHWRFVLDITKAPDPQIAIVLGDFLFNVRSALDHIAVAIAPPDRQRSVSFPILAEPLDDEKEREFRRRTKDMPGAAIAIIEEQQPYNMRLRNPQSKSYSMDPLEALSVLQNADKHRSLAVLVAGLTHPFAKIFWPNEGVGHMSPKYIAAGDDVFTYKDVGNQIRFDEVECEVRGNPKLSVRVDGQDDFELATVTRGILERVRDKVIPRLEPFARG